MVPFGYPPEGSRASWSLGYMVPEVAYAALTDWMFSMENVLPPGPVAEPVAVELLASDAAPAAPLALGFRDAGLADVPGPDPGLVAGLEAGEGAPPDTEPGSSPERQPGVELEPSLPLLCLGGREKRNVALPSLCAPVFDAAGNLLWEGLARMFKGIVEGEKAWCLRRNYRES